MWFCNTWMTHKQLLSSPSPTGGVFWELTEIRQRLDPHKVLLSLAPFWKDPEKFELLNDYFLENWGRELPRTIPFEREIQFVMFQDDWSPCLQPLIYVPRHNWAVSGDAVDEKKTFASFMSGLGGQQREPVVRPKKEYFPGLSMCIGIAIWVFALRVIFGFTGFLNGNAVEPTHEGNSQGYYRCEADVRWEIG